MPIRNFLYLLITFCFFSANAFSAVNGDGKITGKVSDSASGKALSPVSISLVNDWNQRTIDGTLTDEKGNFRLSNLDQGIYRLELSFVGYADKVIPVRITDSAFIVNLGNIGLSQARVNTKVTVTGSNDLIEDKIDRLVYNASKDDLNKGGNGADVLRKVPLLTVDLDGNLSMRGSSNIRVLINGKPSSIMASSVADALKMIPADNIDKVEVITSPSAKYDAEGTAGIVNIITKKKALQGVNGNIYAGAGTRSSNLGATVNMRKGKVGFQAMLGGWFYRSVGINNLLRTSTADTFTSKLEQKGDFLAYGGGLWSQFGLDADLSKFSSLSASARITRGGNYNRNDLNTWLEPSYFPRFKLYDRNSDGGTGMGGTDINVDYRKTFRQPDRELTASLQFSQDNMNVNYEVDQINGAGINNYREKSLNKSFNRELTAQIDYVHPFNRKWNAESGAKTIRRYVQSNYTYDTLNFGNGEYVSDQRRNNDFYYNQDVYAGYGQLSWQPTKKWGYKAGARYEYTTFGGGFELTNTSFTGNPYGNLIPFASLSFTPQRGKSIKAAYTRRIQRPGFNYLNPYINYNDPRNISFGNPNLEAEQANSYEISGSTYKNSGSLYASLYHRRTGNAIESISSINDTGIYQTTYANLGKNVNTGADFNIGYRKDKLTFNINGGASYYYVKSTQTSGPNAGLKNEGIMYRAGVYAAYEFNKKWSAQLFGNFNSPRYTLQGKSTTWYFYSMGARRQFKNKKGGIGLGMDNIFTPYINMITRSKGSNFSFDQTNRMLMWGVRVSFDYRFGAMEFRDYQKKKKRGINNDDLKEGGGNDQTGGQGPGN